MTVPAPKLTLRGLSTSLRVKSFLKGIHFTVIPNRAAALQVMLLGTVNRATIARAYQLVLAAKTLTSSPSRRTITLVPAKKLVGDPRRATVQLVIVATGRTGSRSTTTRQLHIRRSAHTARTPRSRVANRSRPGAHYFIRGSRAKL